MGEKKTTLQARLHELGSRECSFNYPKHNVNATSSILTLNNWLVIFLKYFRVSFMITVLLCESSSIKKIQYNTVTQNNIYIVKSSIL